MGKPAIAFHQKLQDVMDAHVNTALTVFTGLGTTFILLTPEDADLLGDII